MVTPASNLRARVLDVLAEEGYIRGYTRVDHKAGNLLQDLRSGEFVHSEAGRFVADLARVMFFRIN